MGREGGRGEGRGEGGGGGREGWGGSVHVVLDGRCEGRNVGGEDCGRGREGMLVHVL